MDGAVCTCERAPAFALFTSCLLEYSAVAKWTACMIDTVVFPSKLLPHTCLLHVLLSYRSCYCIFGSLRHERRLGVPMELCPCCLTMPSELLRFASLTLPLLCVRSVGRGAWNT